ncbi:ankyrin repeat domain-containing protein [Ehrlichia ruminantium]|uniref:ankyrin repeat domain-containing protein n=1 Tax=Ehrlichia ruminantium TaxID=779 RepID=UPI001FC802E5|nr:ankyrin repeat domain-containing protein [Ehrlichia ruminantium]UOD97942.1 ankyrin repeat domain-containing protein [Ehrlichia ruminantium]
MLIVRKSILERYTRPLLFSKIVMCDVSFLETIRSLECNDILLMKDSLGTVFYYLIMSLYDMSGVHSADSQRAMKQQLKKLLSDAIQSPVKEQPTSLVPKPPEVRETFGTLKSKCKSVSNRLFQALLDVITTEDPAQEITSNEELQQNQKENRSKMFVAVIQAIEILFSKINTAVKQGEVSIETVSAFLAYSDEPCDPLTPDAISALSNLYFLIDDPELCNLSYLLVKTFLLNSAQYTLDSHDRTALHYAVNIPNQLDQKKFFTDIIQKIMQMYPLIIYKLDKFGNNVMHYVTSAPYMNTQIAKYFSEKFPIMNTHKNVHGDLPLHVMVSVNFVFFAKVFSFFSLARVNNMKQLRHCLDGQTLSSMRMGITSLREKNTELSVQSDYYVRECIKYFQYLLTNVPLYYVFQVRNSEGLTVYEILKNNISYVGQGRTDLLLRDFAQVSKKLPVYDNRIDLQHQRCVKLFFSGGHDRIVSKKTFERSLYLYTKYTYELITKKFNKVSHHKKERKNFINMSNKQINISLVSFVAVTFFILAGVNEFIAYMYNNIYKSVICGVISINVFAIVCIFYIVYNNSINNDNARLAQQEAQEIEDILLSCVDIKAIAIDNQSVHS